MIGRESRVAFWRTRAQSTSDSVMRPPWSNAASMVRALLRIVASMTRPPSKNTSPSSLAHLRRDAQHSRLSAEIQQLEDVVDAELAKRSLDRHGYLARDPRHENALQIARGPHFATRAARILARGAEIDDALPSLDRVAIAVLFGEHGAAVKQRADVRRVEAKHAREGVHGVALAPEREQGFTERDQRVAMIRIALE